MNSWRTADQDIPNPDQRLERAELMRNLVGGYHHGQRAAASHQQAGHMTAIAKEPSHQKALAKGPSTYGWGCSAGRSSGSDGSDGQRLARSLGSGSAISLSG
jgi:hypothetical protein